MGQASEQSRGVVIAVGASAGGVEAVSEFVAALPKDLNAAVLVVLHVSARTPSVLPHILERAGRLRASHAVDGEAVQAGHIYVAPPDFHLLYVDGHIELDGGPRVNGVRPAVDVLFRSVALGCGERAIGVVLSGSLDDGTAGLAAIAQHGGHTYAQEPSDAAFPSMPASAASYVRVDGVAPTAALGDLVARCVRTLSGEYADPPGERADPQSPELPSEEIKAMREGAHASEREQEGAVTPFSCPECGGTLWERAEDGVVAYRCRVGHAYSPESLLSRQLESLERALWAAVVALEERGDICERLLARVERGAMERLADHYQHEATSARAQAESLRGAIEAMIRTSGDS